MDEPPILSATSSDEPPVPILSATISDEPPPAPILSATSSDEPPPAPILSATSSDEPPPAPISLSATSSNEPPAPISLSATTTSSAAENGIQVEEIEGEEEGEREEEEREAEREEEGEVEEEDDDDIGPAIRIRRLDHFSLEFDDDIQQAPVDEDMPSLNPEISDDDGEVPMPDLNQIESFGGGVGGVGSEDVGGGIEMPPRIDEEEINDFHVDPVDISRIFSNQSADDPKKKPTRRLRMKKSEKAKEADTKKSSKKAENDKKNTSNKPPTTFEVLDGLNVSIEDKPLMQAASKKPLERRQYSVQYKLEVIDLIKSEKYTRSAISQTLGMSKRCLRAWLGQEDALRAMLDKLEPDALRCRNGGGCRPFYQEVEQELLKWIKQRRAEGKRVCWADIRDLAIRIAAAMNLTEFKVSNAWVTRFFERHNIKSDTNQKDYRERMAKLRKEAEAKFGHVNNRNNNHSNHHSRNGGGKEAVQQHKNKPPAAAAAAVAAASSNFPYHQQQLSSLSANDDSMSNISVVSHHSTAAVPAPAAAHQFSHHSTAAVPAPSAAGAAHQFSYHHSAAPTAAHQQLRQHPSTSTATTRMPPGGSTSSNNNYQVPISQVVVPRPNLPMLNFDDMTSYAAAYFNNFSDNLSQYSDFINPSAPYAPQQSIHHQQHSAAAAAAAAAVAAAAAGGSTTTSTQQQQQQHLFGATTAAGGQNANHNLLSTSHHLPQHHHLLSQADHQRSTNVGGGGASRQSIPAAFGASQTSSTTNTNQSSQPPVLQQQMSSALSTSTNPTATAKAAAAESAVHNFFKLVPAEPSSASFTSSPTKQSPASKMITGPTNNKRSKKNKQHNGPDSEGGKIRVQIGPDQLAMLENTVAAMQRKERLRERERKERLLLKDVVSAGGRRRDQTAKTIPELLKDFERSERFPEFSVWHFNGLLKPAGSQQTRQLHEDAIRTRCQSDEALAQAIFDLINSDPELVSNLAFQVLAKETRE